MQLIEASFNRLRALPWLQAAFESVQHALCFACLSGGHHHAASQYWTSARWQNSFFVEHREGVGDNLASFVAFPSLAQAYEALWVRNAGGQTNIGTWFKWCAGDR